MPQTVPVPSYVSANAKRGLKMHEDGHSGDGLKPQTVREARDMVEGSISEDKVRRMGPWLRRHEADLDAPKNKDPKAPGYPGPGLVAWLLWGGDANGNMRAAEWAERTAARLDAEREEAAGLTRSVKIETDMTLEQINETLTKELNTLKVEAASAVAKLGDTEKLLAEATAAVVALDTLKAEHANTVKALEEATAKVAALEAAAAPAAAQAAAVVAACGVDPAAISPETPEAPAAAKEATVLDRWQALPVGSKERAAFFKANKTAIHMALMGR
jgi:hypothetical protein